MKLKEDPLTTPEEDNSVTAKISPQLGAWLTANKVSILISSYQSGRLFVVGADVEGRVILQHHIFDRAMGISTYKAGFVFATLHQIWKYCLINAIGKPPKNPETLLIPQNCHYTGFVNCHDVAKTDSDGILYASTLFNCVATTGENSNLVPVWVPPFIQEFVPEDRCHLNGIAKVNGKLRFVSVLGKTAEKAGWRKDHSKGAIFDIKSNKAIASDLWMPHSPRVHGRRLYALESGQGSFGAVADGKIAKNLLLPGFTRGLDFYDGIAAVGHSKPRAEPATELPLGKRLEANGIEASCGIVLFDIITAKVLHSIQFTSGVEELYDVAFLHGTSNPRLIHPTSSEVIKIYSVGLKSRKAGTKG